MSWLGWHSKSVLAWVCASFLLASCGGADSTEGISASEAASRAVNQGLAGAVFGHLNAARSDIGVAGLRRLGTADSLSGHEHFIIGSNTKAMTAAAAASLIERGTLRWDSTIAEVMPELLHDMRPEYRNITLEQLLAHRGGVLSMQQNADYQAFQAHLSAFAGTLPQTLQERRHFFVHWLLRQAPPPNVTPGRDFLYSNGGYVIVGAMLEAASGKTFDKLFDEALSQPLGVPGSWVRPELMAADQPVGHEGPHGQLAVVPPYPTEAQQWLDVLAPAGLFSTTPAAYTTWLRWHLLALQGQATPLPQSYVRRLKQIAPGDYAVGWAAIDHEGRLMLAHSGHWPGFITEAFVDFSGKEAEFAFTNSGDAGGDDWVVNVLNAQFTELIKRVL